MPMQTRHLSVPALAAAAAAAVVLPPSRSSDLGSSLAMQTPPQRAQSARGWAPSPEARGPRHLGAATWVGREKPTQGSLTA
eukprot:351824-Chlamydomonas_euryale.AAC.4